LTPAQKAEIQVMANQAQEIVNAIQKDGSWGVHAPKYTLQKANQAKILVDGAQAALAGQRTQVAAKAR
jgi:hypothetical protein